MQTDAVREMYNDTLLCVGPTSEESQEHYTITHGSFQNACDTNCKNYPHLRGQIFGEMAAQVGK